MDTFDPKPGASADVKGEFKPIDTSVPGLSISEVFPNLAKVMNKVTLIRSMTSPESDHDRAAHHLMTGYRPSPALVYPGYGSVVARTRESTRGHAAAVRRGSRCAALRLERVSHARVRSVRGAQATRIRRASACRTSRLRTGLTLERLLRRRDMVKSLDDFAHDVSETPLTTSRDQFSERAYSLLTSSSAQSAFKIQEEPEKVRDKYGRTTAGQACLLARRLVEAGVAFVTVNDRGANQLGWDTHAQNFPTIKNTLAPPIDKGLSRPASKISSERGLLETTLVV